MADDLRLEAVIAHARDDRVIVALAGRWARAMLPDVNDEPTAHAAVDLAERFGAGGDVSNLEAKDAGSALLDAAEAVGADIYDGPWESMIDLVECLVQATRSEPDPTLNEPSEWAWFIGRRAGGLGLAADGGWRDALGALHPDERPEVIEAAAAIGNDLLRTSRATRVAWMQQAGLDRLEAVIGLPANLFYSTAIPACLLIIPVGIRTQVPVDP